MTLFQMSNPHHPIIFLPCIIFFFQLFQDAEADIRLSRRLQRDTKERGRTVDQVLSQYHETVRPMHEAWVEPSKKEADFIIHSAGHSMEVAIEMLTNHLRVKAGLL